MSAHAKILPFWGRWPAVRRVGGGLSLAPTASLRSAPPPVGEDFEGLLWT